MKTVCNDDQCCGCKACADVCPKAAISINDNLFSFTPVITENKCIDCGLCKRVCPSIHKRTLQQPIFCKQGWAEKNIREYSASGGIASELMIQFIADGGFVCSCIYEDGNFPFLLTNNIEDIRKFAGSKYVKSDPEGVYKQIGKLLRKRQKVLFIGLPCQCAALLNIYPYNEYLYTIDLICHGTPSILLFKKYLIESGIKEFEKVNIKFRSKNIYGLYKNGIKITPNRVSDSYMLSFLKGVDYTEKCYSCDYASVMRVSDITLGDAWGGMAENNSEGVSLVLCLSDKGKELLNKCNIELFDFELETAVNGNRQLRSPMPKNPGREKFAKNINKSFRFATLKAMPLLTFKQCIKYTLIKVHILKDIQG